MTNTVKIAVLLFVFVSICSASTAVIIVDDDRILIGADSKLQYSLAGTGAMCKINTEFKNCTFVVTGIAADRALGFDAERYANHACNAKATFAEIIQSFAAEAEPTLANVLLYKKLYEPKIYEIYLGRRNSPFAVAFAGFEKGKPIAVTVEFMLDEKGTLSKTFRSAPVDGNLFTLGVGDAAFQFVSDIIGKPTTIFEDRPALILKLIEIEIAADPDDVGPPISILEIREQSHRWLEDGLCICSFALS